MKLFACCVVVLAVASLGQCATSSEELMAMKVNMLKNYLKERQAVDALSEKLETICPGYSSKFETALEKVERCVDDIDENSETMCSAVKNHFETCSSPIVKVLEECLPEKSRDIPSFAFKAVMSISDYLCKTDGEHIFELSNPCVRSQNFRTQRCLRKLQNKYSQYNTKMPSKNEACDALTSLRGCLESHLHYSCGNVKTREAFLNVFDAGVSSCSSNELNEIEVLEPKRQWISEV